jgi:hypothetical protein
MAFNVGDIVRKIGKTQKYKVKEVVGVEYKVQYEPLTAPDVVLEFKESELELAS